MLQVPSWFIVTQKSRALFKRKTFGKLHRYFILVLTNLKLIWVRPILVPDFHKIFLSIVAPSDGMRGSRQLNISFSILIGESLTEPLPLSKILYITCPTFLNRHLLQPLPSDTQPSHWSTLSQAVKVKQTFCRGKLPAPQQVQNMQLVCSRQISPHRSILSTPANISMRSEMSQATSWLLQLTGLPTRVSLGRICARRKSREEYVWTLILTRQECKENNLHKVYLSLGCQRKGILLD